jgi:hypothetical protein
MFKKLEMESSDNIWSYPCSRKNIIYWPWLLGLKSPGIVESKFIALFWVGLGELITEHNAGHEPNVWVSRFGYKGIC